MNRLIVSALAIFATTLPAAAWNFDVEGPDVFGKTKVFALDGGDRESLVIRCDSEGDLIFGMIVQKKPFEDVERHPADFFIRIDGNDLIRADAERRNWNDNYFGFFLTNPGVHASEIVAQLEAARRKIDVGIQVGENQASFTFGVGGSTKAMQAVRKHCDLSKSAPPT